MKKATLTFGLLSLIVLTSFTTIQDSGDDDNGTGGDGTTTTTTTTTTDDAGRGNSGGGQNIPPIKKITDPIPFTVQYPNQEIPLRRK